jgi:hypothetical protein
MTRARRKPLDKDLYEAVVEEAKARFAVWPSAYASGWVVQTYKARGGRYAGQGRKESTGLTRWFGESWVDLSRPTADGGYEPCGRKRTDAPFDAAQYPKCRPLKEALRMSPNEVKDAIKRKRAAEAKAGRGAKGRGGRGARAPVRVATYRKNPDPTHDHPRAQAQWFHGGSVEDARQVKALGHFPAEYAPRLGNYGAGVYLTSNKEEARRFGDVVIGASVDPSVRLLDLRDPTYRAMPSSVFDHLTSPQAKAAFEERWNASDLPGAVVEGATADGYGGVIWTGDDWNDWAVVFDPTQVRAEAGAPARGSRARAPKRVATYRKNPDADAVALEILQATGSLAAAIAAIQDVDPSMTILAVGVPPKAIEDTLWSWVPAPIPPTDDDVDVFFATDEATADQILREGVIPQLKPTTLARARYEAGEPAVFSPGRGLSGGIYVGASPRAVESYGEVILKIRVPKSLLDVSPEQASLGVKDAEESLSTHDGAVILHAIPPENIEVEDEARANPPFGDEPELVEARANPAYEYLTPSALDAPIDGSPIDGDALAAWCASDESYAVLDETASAGSSWMAGACVLLAKALVARHPEAQLVGLEVDGDVQHVGALVGDVVYDALGAHRERRWARDWLAYEQLDPRTPARLVSLPPGVPASAQPHAAAPATARDVRLVARALPA